MSSILTEMQKQSQNVKPENFICEQCVSYDGGVGCKQNIFIAFKGANMVNCCFFEPGMKCPHCGKRFKGGIDGNYDQGTNEGIT